ncbi:MAG: HNH endonuclease [Planctomycetota bacterium]|nr:HNH endonuclease [Planctomycetota bacterium]
MAVSKQIKQKIADRAGHRCEYCQSPQKYSIDSLSVEHIIPKSKGGPDTDSNLALACQRCNNHKFLATECRDPLSGRLAPLYNPRIDVWTDHFAWSADSLLIQGISSVGRGTESKLQLNRESVVNLRRLLIGVDEHPPFGAT